MKNSILLIRTLLLSTSRINLMRHSGDKKQRGRIIGNAIGVVVLYAMMVGLGVAVCIGYGKMGLIHAAPVLCALMISALSFVFTLFKTNGYLFNFREYDMLMSLPFEARTVAACKFAYMYIKSLPWYASISLAMMIGYGIFAHPPVIVYPLWVVLSLLLPLIPMLIASFLGFLIARVSAGFRKTNIIQTILTFASILMAFALRFIIEGMFRDNQVESVLTVASRVTGSAANIYLPARWFADAVTKPGLSDALLLAGVSLVLFGVVFAIVGHSYRRINSALKSHAAAKRYQMSGQKQRGVLGAIVFKEFKRLTGSTAYITNAAVGEVLAVLLGLVALVIGAEKIVATITNNAPFDYAILQPAIPLIVYFFIGMMSTTVCSLSLEGKNYWILQSLPIEKKTVYQGKMLFNLLLTVPAMLISTLCLCVSAKVPAVDVALYILLGLALCAFSTAWGCVCGIRHMRLDWNNEIEVIKQGTAVTVYMLPNMIAVIGLTVLVVFLGTRMDHRLVILLLTLVAAVLATLSYRRVMALAKKDSRPEGRKRIG